MLKTTKRLLSIMLAVAMVFTVMPADQAYAASKKVKVTFNANGGKIETAKSKTVSIAKNKKIGKKLPAASKMIRSGYAFKGWYSKKSGGKKITKSTKIKKKTTYYAQWKKQTEVEKLVGHWYDNSYNVMGGYWEYWHWYINKDGTFHYLLITTAEYSYKGKWSASKGKIYFKDVVFTNDDYKANRTDSYVDYVFAKDSKGVEQLRISNTGGCWMGSPWWYRS